MSGRFLEYRVFFREFRRNFYSTGAISPSSGFLARALARYVKRPLHDGQPSDNGGRRILEVGPGTGAVTRHILAALQAGDTLDLVELNDAFVQLLQERLASDPNFRPYADRVRVLHQKVEDMPADAQYDLVISGLPLNNFPVPAVEAILATLQRLVKPGGVLSYFEYVALRRIKACVCRKDERERLQGVGRVTGEALRQFEIRRDCIVFNAPPAWVHHLRFAEPEAPPATSDVASQAST